MTIPTSQQTTQTAVRAVLLSIESSKILATDMDSKYDQAELDNILRHTALKRGAIKKLQWDDLGKFKPVYNKLKEIATKDFNDEKFIKACDKLESEIHSYVARFEDDGTRKKKQLGSQKDTTVRRDNKLYICDMILHDIGIWKAQRTHPDEVALLQELDTRVANGEQIPFDELGKYQEANARILLELNGKTDVVHEEGGTSEVALLKNGDGTVAYAFKTIRGESTQMNMDPGCGAMREAMTSSACQLIKESTGLDFRFPVTSIATMQYGTEDVSGALVEGFNGTLCPPPPTFDSSAEDKQSYDVAIDDFMNSIPKEDLQKILLFNLALCQFDIKFDNIVVESGSARPFDGGAAFYSQEQVDQDLKATGRWQVVPGDALLGHPDADQPFDQTVVQGFLQINETQLAGDLTNERDRIAAQAPGLDASLLDDACIRLSKISIGCVKQLLRKNPPLTMREFVTEYHKLFTSQV